MDNQFLNGRYTLNKFLNEQVFEYVVDNLQVMLEEVLVELEQHYEYLKLISRLSINKRRKKTY